ncbi:DUF1214 domain-containing protein [Mycolicibacterium sp. XJ662]
MSPDGVDADSGQSGQVPPIEGWEKLVDGLRDAGRRLDESTADLDSIDRADGFRALVRAANNLLGRFESSRDRPELVPFNGWRERFFMDNPDYRYWITDIRDDCVYRITGNVGDSVYQSMTVYAGTIENAAAVARTDTDSMAIDDNGDFEVLLSSDANHLELPDGSSSLWVRYVHTGSNPVDPGSCRIDVVQGQEAASAVDPSRLQRDLTKLGAFLGYLPDVFAAAAAGDMKTPNTVRHWSAMTGGAAFTEPGIHYLRGAWQLEDDEALVIEGSLPRCRHWNIVLYNRFLNSLDYRRHTVTHSAASTTVDDGHFRFVLAARAPGVEGYDWLDTEGRRFGLFVMRFLQPVDEPALPTARRVTLSELEGL